MKIGGLQKTTLLDYPGRVAATVFTQGCSLRCPYCHNASLVLPERLGEAMGEEAVLAHLIRRRGVLDGVCVTGGEPLLQEDLADFLRRVKGLGLAVKLDTNGCRPARLAALMDEGLVDYVAMDVKAAAGRYAQAVGIPGFDLAPVRESAALLLAGRAPYEFRTTLTRELHPPEEVEELARCLSGAARYYLQSYRDSGDVLEPGFTPYTPEELRGLLALVRRHIPAAQLRGID